MHRQRSHWQGADSSAAVEVIRKKDQNLSSLWHTDGEINILESTLDRFEVSKIGRECNQAAHELAELARVSAVNNFGLGHVRTKMGPSVVAVSNSFYEINENLSSLKIKYSTNK